MRTNSLRCCGLPRLRASPHRGVSKCVECIYSPTWADIHRLMVDSRRRNTVVAPYCGGRTAQQTAHGDR